MIGNQWVRIYDWESMIGSLQLGVYDWESMIGNLWLGVYDWESMIGNLWFGIYDWKSMIGNLWLEISEYESMIGNLWLGVYNWEFMIGSLWLGVYDWEKLIEIHYVVLTESLTRNHYLGILVREAYTDWASESLMECLTTRLNQISLDWLTEWMNNAEITYHAVEDVERRLKIEMNAEAVHFEEHLKHKQTQEDELCIGCKYRQSITYM